MPGNSLREFIEEVEELKRNKKFDSIMSGSASMVQRMPKDLLDELGEEDILANLKIVANTQLLLMLIDAGYFDD